MYKNYFKPIIDFFFASILFIISSPIFIVISIILYFVNEGKVFFIQPRPGKNSRVFNIIKFKTMTDATDKNGNLLPDDKRLTGFGKFLRNTSFDEIPQFINVLKGDLSLVGPRPLRVEYLDYYSQEQSRRHDVKPGITGWAQCHGRNSISWTKKFELDVWYVDHCFLLIDIKIIFLTIKKVLIKEGISKEGEVTTVPFNGKN